MTKDKTIKEQEEMIERAARAMYQTPINTYSDLEVLEIVATHSTDNATIKTQFFDRAKAALTASGLVEEVERLKEENNTLKSALRLSTSILKAKTDTAVAYRKTIKRHENLTKIQSHLNNKGSE